MMAIQSQQWTTTPEKEKNLQGKWESPKLAFPAAALR